MGFGPLVAPYLILAGVLLFIIYSMWVYWKGYTSGRDKADKKWRKQLDKLVGSKDIDDDAANRVADYLDSVDD